MNNSIGLYDDENKILSLIATGSVNPTFTLQTRIEPLLTAQAGLATSVSGFNFNKAVLNGSFWCENTMLFSAANPIHSLGSGLSMVSKIATDSNLLLKVPSYDYIREPILSMLGSAVDTIKVNQNQILSFIPNTKPSVNYATTPYLAHNINQISSLGNIALGYLESSPSIFYSGIKSNDSEIDTYKKKIVNLELRVEKIENENRRTKLTDITNDVSNRLEIINPDLSKCFRGAMATLIADQSEDLVGQVAESLTRVIEELPFLLSNKKEFQSKNKEGKIREALENYLGLKQGKGYTNHIFLQQQGYYTVLSDIRHRNEDVYRFYNNDKNLFKAIVIQIEAYIYMLITFKNEN